MSASISRYIVGVDIGTTSTKAVLFDARGRTICRRAIAYPLRAPVPGAAEQDPTAILAAVERAVAGVLTAETRHALGGLSFSSAMHSMLAVDRGGQPLTPHYTWADRRAQSQAETLQRDRPDFYMRTGVPLHPMSPLVKLCWLRAAQPELWSQAARFVSIKEYVLYHLCGEWVVDWAVAAASGLLQFAQCDWDRDALQLAQLTPERLSELVPTDRMLHLCATQAERWQVAPALPVVVGASDGVLSNFGLGVEPDAAIAVSLGTSGAARATVRQPRLVSEQGLFCYPLHRDYWALGGATNSGGLAWRWLRDRWLHLPAERGDEQLDELAASVPPGADGLMFHPYLTGERAPLWNSQACGSFFGLRFEHSRAHAARAVLEGVLCNLALIVAATRAATGHDGPIWATGGVFRSTLWRQTLADICNCEVSVPVEREDACWGAARLGFAALGRPVAAASVSPDNSDRHLPNPDCVPRYQTLRSRYARLLSDFKPLYVPSELTSSNKSC